MMIFRSPYFFLLLPVAVAVIIAALKKDQAGGLKFSSGRLVEGMEPSVKVFLSRKLVMMRLATAILIVLALARCR